jgi:hypothetical protein
MFGYSPSTTAALEELTRERDETGVTIISRHDVPEMEGVTHHRLDYLSVEGLRDQRVGLDRCSVCVVFAEPGSSAENPRTTDMHTVLAVYNIKQERRDVPVIAEVLDRDNTTFIDELGCDDVIYKETIDSNLITSCVLHPHISPIFYDLLTIRGKTLESTTLEELGFEESDVTYGDIRMRGLEEDVTYLGYVDRSGSVRLMPPNDTHILSHYRLVFIS